MAKIELRTRYDGQSAQLLINGVDVSEDVRSVQISFDVHNQGKVWVEYRGDDITAEGDFAEFEEPF